MKKKAKYMAMKNAIRRLQDESEATSISGGGDRTTSERGEIILYCSSCRGKQPHKRETVGRHNSHYKQTCIECGRETFKPVPEPVGKPIGAFLIEKRIDGNLEGMTMAEYHFLTEMGLCPIDEEPFLKEKGIQLRGR